MITQNSSGWGDGAQSLALAIEKISGLLIRLRVGHLYVMVFIYGESFGAAKRGWDLLRVLLAMIDWGMKHIPGAQYAEQAVEQAIKNQSERQLA